MADETETTLDYPTTARAAARPVPHLVVARGPDADSTWRAVPLRGRQVIGRSASCDLPLPGDRRASREHARLDGATLTDLDSHNRLFVNGVAVQEATLHANDVVRVGDSVLVVTEGPPNDHGLSELFGRSPAIALAADQLRRYAKADVEAVVHTPG